MKNLTFAFAILVTLVSASYSAAATSEPKGAGVTVETFNGEMQSAVGPEHCKVSETSMTVAFVTSPPALHPVPSSIDLRTATSTSPEKTVTVYSANYVEDYCASSNSPKAYLVSGKQSLVVDRSQANPRYALTTTLQCSDGRTAIERKFVVKCDLNF